jgi:hypothetical protein
LPLAALVVVSFVAIGAAYAPALSSQRSGFEAHLAIREATAPDALCRGLRVHHVGGGMATHLGQATWSGGECADFLATPGRVHVRDGRGVLTSRNGDELHVSYEADGNLPSFGGEVHVKGPFAVTGGTGRFSGASGGGTFSADVNAFRPDGTIDLIGTLSLSL